MKHRLHGTTTRGLENIERTTQSEYHFPTLPEALVETMCVSSCRSCRCRALRNAARIDVLQQEAPHYDDLDDDCFRCPGQTHTRSGPMPSCKRTLSHRIKEQVEPSRNKCANEGGLIPPVKRRNISTFRKSALS